MDKKKKNYTYRPLEQRKIKWGTHGLKQWRTWRQHVVGLQHSRVKRSFFRQAVLNSPPAFYCLLLSVHVNCGFVFCNQRTLSWDERNFYFMLNMATTWRKLYFCEAAGMLLTIHSFSIAPAPQVLFVPQLFEEAAWCRRVPWQRQRLSAGAAWPCPGSWWLLSECDHPRGAWNWSIRILKIFVMPSCHFSEQRCQEGVETDGSKPKWICSFLERAALWVSPFTQHSAESSLFSGGPVKVTVCLIVKTVRSFNP